MHILTRTILALVLCFAASLAWAAGDCVNCPAPADPHLNIMQYAWERPSYFQIDIGSSPWVDEPYGAGTTVQRSSPSGDWGGVFDMHNTSSAIGEGGQRRSPALYVMEVQNGLGNGYFSITAGSWSVHDNPKADLFIGLSAANADVFANTTPVHIGALRKKTNQYVYFVISDGTSYEEIASTITWGLNPPSDTTHYLVTAEFKCTLTSCKAWFNGTYVGESSFPIGHSAGGAHDLSIIYALKNQTAGNTEYLSPMAHEYAIRQATTQ